MSIRTYHDPLHRGITLNSNIPEEKMVMNLIDSSPFQRLRRIKQLGPAYLTFHGAESSRFTHSLGVFHIARRALELLAASRPELNKFKGILYSAALLHDIGHGPLSHTSEEMFGINHETWSAKLIYEHPEIRENLDLCSKDIAPQVKALIIGKDIQCKLIKTLVSSQLDCDRLDYLMRDSYSSGTTYGQLDLERILSALTLAPDGDLAINPKGLLAVEHYLIVRNLMYRSVYNHRLNEVSNWLLEQIIQTARTIGPKEVWSDNCMKKWLWDPKRIDIDIFLANDDIRTNYHLLRWKEEGPEPLKKLCSNFFNRKLLKAVNIEDMKKEDQLFSLAIAIRLTEEIGMDHNLNCGLRHTKVYGYRPYESGLRIWDGSELKALEKESPLVENLINPSKSSWLIYPKQIDSTLLKELKVLRRAIKKK